jgi:hypothetical protein
MSLADISDIIYNENLAISKEGLDTLIHMLYQVSLTREESRYPRFPVFVRSREESCF